MKRILIPLALIIVTLLFFWKFFLQSLLPIPADTIVGMYHPWRDFFAQEYPSGIPFKNFLITDPVRQQYPWRKLAVESLKQGKWPLWNPYTFSGTPLLASFQSAAFYPLNILFFVLSFEIAWSILIILQPILAGLFLFLYLRHFNVRSEACFLGSLSFAFSGFFLAWLEWNTILHAALWLPLLLLALEKIFGELRNPVNEKVKRQNVKLQLKSKNLILWSTVFIFSLISSFFAGHLQTFFYVFLASLIYLVGRVLSLNLKQRKKALFLVALLLCGFVAITSVQWLPTFRFIKLSARELDQVNWQKEGWFVPWQHLIQFLAPDFFGSPATLNYWGTWNYGELVGYIGILPLIMAFLALIWRKDKKTLFFGSLFFLSLLFALPTPLAKLPYQLKLPFLATSQPTRLLFLTDFSLVILAALGLDCWLKKNSINQAIKLLLAFSVVFVILWTFVLLGSRWLNTPEWLTNLSVAKRNLILPTGLFLISATLLFLSKVLHFLGKDHLRGVRSTPRTVEKFLLISPRRSPSGHLRGGLQEKCKTLLITIFLLIFLIFDLFRFGWKFTPFTKKEYLFPSTQVIDFLKKQKEPFRIMATDKRILPPNFSLVYKLETIDGYDPLYSLRYGEMIIASERGKPDISPPFGFNRMITPQNYQSRIIDLLNVKYILSLKDEDSSQLVKVFQEGQVRVYENKNVFPRSFLVYDYQVAKDKQEAIEFLMDESIELSKTAILEKDLGKVFSRGGKAEVEIADYDEQSVDIKVATDQEGILILTDNFYPGWQAMIDDSDESVKTFRVDYNLRGIVVPEGEHEVHFYPSL